MEVDGLSAEVLYPTLGLELFGLDDAKLQEACFRVYNNWLIEYCRVAPQRLVGVAAISVYDIDHAIQELERCRKAGLKGAMIWQAPHKELPFRSVHYNRFWETAQELDVPISLHILTGKAAGCLSLPGEREPKAFGCYECAVRVHLLRRPGATP